MGHKRIITQVAEYIVANAGRTIPIGELEAETGLTSAQIAGAVNNWRNKPGVRDKLAVVIAGRAWSWADRPKTATPKADTNGDAPEHPHPPAITAPDKDPCPQMFEHIGQSVTGTLILRDDNGKLYTATEL